MSDAAGKAPLVVVYADPEAYLLPEAAFRLLVRLEDPRRDLVFPVSNEPWTDEALRTPAFPYHTPSQLAELVRFVAAGDSASIPRQSSAPRSPVYAVRRELLGRLPGALPLDEVPEEAGRRGHAVFFDPGAYLHRYGEMDGQARGDLAAKIPVGARSVLDVGCSRGQTARLLRDAGVARIVGVEPDSGDAAEASSVCDRVLATALEEITEEFPGEFDAILFGDVLEHLIDPSAALVKVRPWLSPGGVVIASVPNIGHWSVVSELLEGRFDYVPYSILSGTHIRFFTRRTIRDLFEACGYGVESVSTVVFPTSPAGAQTLAFLRTFPNASDDLTAAEFLVTATADS